MQQCQTPEDEFILGYKEYIKDHPESVNEESVSDQYAEMLATAKFNKLKFKSKYLDQVEYFIDLVDTHILENPTLTSLPRPKSAETLAKETRDEIMSKLPTKMPPAQAKILTPQQLQQQQPPKTSPVPPQTKVLTPPQTKVLTPQQQQQQQQAVPPKPFPYKRDLMTQEDVDSLWRWATQDEPDWIKLNCHQDTELPFKGNVIPESWLNWIPKGFTWSYNNMLCIIQINKTEAYMKVDRLVDYFSEQARMQACITGKPSPLEYYKRNQLSIQGKAEETVRKIQRQGERPLPIRHYERELIYDSGTECTSFKISLAKLVYKVFEAKIVFDPSAGWGDRMLGAGAAGVQVYFGTDPNPALREPYDQIRDFLHSKGLDTQYYSVATTSFLDFDITGHETRYDLVFTSPPYYNYEIYSSAPGQSIAGKKSVSDWITGFLFPYIQKAWMLLHSEGTLVLYISDVNRSKYVEEMIKFIDTFPDSSYQGNIAVIGNNPDLSTERALPLWIWRKYEEEEQETGKEEEEQQ